MAPLRILGVDPGLNTTGYAVIEETAAQPKLLEAGVVRSADRRATPELVDRLKAIYDGLAEVIEQFRPNHLAVEELYAHYDHPRTAILMAHARGVVLLAAGQRGVPVSSYAATQIKKAVTGSGRAGKEQMQLAMLREFHLSQMPEPHDVADALAIALCHFHSRKVTSPQSAVRSPQGRGVNLRNLLGD